MTNRGILPHFLQGDCSIQTRRMVEIVFQDQTFIGMERQVCLDATRLVQADDNFALTAEVATRQVNSGIGDDDETGSTVEAMIRCPDEESGKAVEDARLAEVDNTRSQRGKKMGEVMATSPPRLPLHGEEPIA